MKRNIFVIFLGLIFSSVYAEAPVVDYSTNVAGVEARAKSSDSSYGHSDKQRIKILERQIKNINRQDLLNRIEELQESVQKLSGKNEAQERKIEQLHDQLKDFYGDLNRRLDEKNGSFLQKASDAEFGVVKESSVIPAAAGTLIGGIKNKSKDKDKEKQKDKEKEEGKDESKDKKDKEVMAKTKKEMEEQQMYQTAIDLLPEKKHESRLKLRAYLKQYPEGAYVANAHYWLGEINFLERDFDAAEEEFKVVVDKYSKSRRVPDAMLKLALVHQNQGKEKKAKKELQDLIKRYPETPAAHLAKQQLVVN